MQSKIGQTAGLIWHYLNGKDEPQSLIKIKTALAIPNSLTHLALGWLAREDKIIITEKSNTLYVALKK